MGCTVALLLVLLTPQTAFIQQFPPTHTHSFIDLYIVAGYTVLSSLSHTFTLQWTHGSQCGVQSLAQGDDGMCSGGARNRATDFAIGRWAELQPAPGSLSALSSKAYLMVWRCIRAYRTGNLHIWKGTIKAERYIQGLEQHLFLSRWHLFQGGACIFKKDNAKLVSSIPSCL